MPIVTVSGFTSDDMLHQDEMEALHKSICTTMMSELKVGTMKSTSVIFRERTKYDSYGYIIRVDGVFKKPERTATVFHGLTETLCGNMASFCMSRFYDDGVPIHVECVVNTIQPYQYRKFAISSWDR